MLKAERRSFSEINLAHDSNFEEPVNFEKNTKQNEPINAFTASQVLFQRIESSIKIAAKHEAINTSNFISSCSSNLKYFAKVVAKDKKVLNLKKIKCDVYNLLERPSGKLAFIYRLFTFILILTPILLNTMSTIKPVKNKATHVLLFIEIFVTFYFFFEYCIRVWSSSYRGSYYGINGKIKFMTRPIMIIEILLFLIGSLLLIVNVLQNYSSNNFFQNLHIAEPFLIILRFAQLVRLLYVDRKAHTWELLMDVIIKHKYELITSVYIAFILLLLSSYLIFICENSTNPSFRTYSDALYWSIITMATIGYGDITPKTFYGKAIATTLCIIGVAFWTLPGGIIGSGFALKVEQKNKREQFNRLVPAAASLIQTWWRMKVVSQIPTSNNSRLLSVLKVFQTNSLTTTKSTTHQNSNTKELKTKKSMFSIHGSPEKLISPNARFIREDKIEDNDEIFEDRRHLISNNKAKYSEEAQLKMLKKINPKTIILLRVLLVLKFLVANRKFKFAHKPYDFKDVIEQYTQGNMDIIIKIKELQRKLDHSIQLQRNHSTPHLKSTFQKNPHRLDNKIKENDNTENKVSEIQKSIIKIENRIDTIENKLDRILSVIENRK